ncbi:MAG: hypothetical protein EAZ27_12905 [Cytophagales bacterium]|nr:MAG: hypothetical protein EAZ27_12905 [Cytophagales bacterium]
MKKSILISTFALVTSIVSISQNLPSAPAIPAAPAAVPATTEQMQSEADKFKKEGMPAAESAVKAAAPTASLADPKVQMVMTMLTQKLNLKPTQIDKVKGLVSKMDMTKLNDPKAQAKALVSSYTPDLGKILDPSQMTKLKGLAASKK